MHLIYKQIQAYKVGRINNIYNKYMNALGQ